MIQRSLLRASRQLPARIPSRTFAQPPRQLSAPLARFPQLSTRVASRWYSDITDAKPQSEAKAEDQKSAPDRTASETAANGANGLSEVDKLRADLESMNKEVISLKDQYLRSIADYRNLQERTKREVQAARDFALQRLAKDLLSSLDNLEHALSSVPASRLDPPAAEQQQQPLDAAAAALRADLRNLHEGLQLTERVLLETLARHGLVRVDPAAQAERFDPNLHEAVFQAPVPGKEDGVVFHTQQKGFILNGRVIRAPKVGVVKNS